MKISKPKSKDLTDGLLLVGGAVVGALLSNGVSQAIPLDNKKITKGIVAGTGVVGAAAIKGTDGLSTFAKGAAIGMATQQSKELVKEVAAPHLPDTKFIQDSFEQTPIAAAPTKTLARSLGRMGNPDMFRLGNRIPTTSPAGSFIAG